MGSVRDRLYCIFRQQSSLVCVPPPPFRPAPASCTACGSYTHSSDSVRFGRFLVYDMLLSYCVFADFGTYCSALRGTLCWSTPIEKMGQYAAAELGRRSFRLRFSLFFWCDEDSSPLPARDQMGFLLKILS